jgi:crossover junction endodeoxyribonuclease RuvC
MIYVGIDPGLTGAIAIIKEREKEEAMSEAIPVIREATGRKTKKKLVKGKVRGGNPQFKIRLDLANLLAAFKSLADTSANGETVVVALENVHPMPTDGVRQIGSLMHTRGVLEALLFATGFTPVLVSPSSWRPKIVGKGTNKEAALILARQLFPSVDLKLKKDEGRAEALLIAEYLRRKEKGTLNVGKNEDGNDTAKRRRSTPRGMGKDRKTKNR